MRRRYGEEVHQKSFLIREQFDVRNPNAIPRKIVSVFTLTNKLIDLGIRVGIRQKEKLPENMKHLGSSFRKAVPAAHGFRKFFTTQLVNLKVNPEIREMLLGHTIGLAGAYYKPTDDDFLEEYEKVIDSLTINEENRLRRTVEILKIEKSKLETIAKDVAFLKRKYNKLKV